VDKIILQARELFEDAGFDYAVCGGFALDMFAGKQLREHGDFDLLFFEEDRQKTLQFLRERDWQLYARFMEDGKPITNHLFYLIENPADNKWIDVHNVWAVLPNSYAKSYPIERLGEDVFAFNMTEPRLQTLDFIEICFDKRRGGNFIAKEIALPMERAILSKDGIPYMSPELVLFLKTPEFYTTNAYQKPKTEADFGAVMPLLSAESKMWLINAIKTTYPDGTPWLDGII